MDYSGKVILCTGASGFIGKNLAARLLSKNATVVSIVPEQDELPPFSNLIVYRGRIEDSSLVAAILERHRFDYVVHLAATATIQESFDKPNDAFTTNIRGTWTLFESLRKSHPNVKGILYASTDKVYGEGKSRPYREDDAIEARHVYDVSKACGDFIARGYYYNYGLPVLTVRFCNVYGPNDLNWSRIVPKTIRSLHENTRPTVNMFLNENKIPIPFKRDFIYVDDVVRGLESMLQAADSGNLIGETFNFGTGQCHAVSDIVSSLCRFYGKEIEPKINIVSSGEIFSQCMNYEKARQLLGFAPQISLEEGLLRTIAWYRDYLD